jgi:hypothetical protein
MYFVTNRWLGGTLTNFRTIKGGLDRLRTLERMKDDGTYEQLLKKEVAKLEKERERLEKYLGGLKGMASPRTRSSSSTRTRSRSPSARRAARDPGRRHHGHQLRPRPHRLRHPRQRRRHPLDPPDRDAASPTPASRACSAARLVAETASQRQRRVRHDSTVAVQRAPRAPALLPRRTRRKKKS